MTSIFYAFSENEINLNSMNNARSNKDSSADLVTLLFQTLISTTHLQVNHFLNSNVCINIDFKVYMLLPIIDRHGVLDTSSRIFACGDFSFNAGSIESILF